jgi:hypothetical protein
MRLAVEHVRRMRGGAQAHLMRCDNATHYIVKFQDNPQHLKILANEMLAARLAAHLDICVPPVDIIEVRKNLIELTVDLVVQLRTSRKPCSAGKQFGSQFPGNPWHMKVYDDLPDEWLDRVRNIEDFLGIFVFDKWTCNTDRRQAIFVPECDGNAGNVFGHTCYRAMMIDHGFCFNAGEWNFPDAPLRGLYARNRVYQSVTGMESLEPWLDRLEKRVTETVLLEEARRIPPEWYAGDWHALERLIERLYVRRSRMRELISATRHSTRDPFPNWKVRAHSVGAA